MRRAAGDGAFGGGAGIPGAAPGEAPPTLAGGPARSDGAGSREGVRPGAGTAGRTGVTGSCPALASLPRWRPQPVPRIPDLVVVGRRIVVWGRQVQAAMIETADGTQQRVRGDHPV